MIKVWRILLIVGAIFITWRIAAVGMSDHYASRAAEGDSGAAARALAWSSSHPQAGVAEAAALMSQDPEAAESRLQASYRRNPADSEPLRLLAQLADRQNATERADALFAQAIRLAPADPDLLLSAASYSARQGDVQAAVLYWSQALEADPRRTGVVFPVLLQLIEDARTQGAIRPLAASPPSWWDGYFAMVARRALDVETVRALYGLRRAALGAPISPREREAYVARLQREGLITEAYLVWVNGLSPEERRYLGLLFDGSFEIEPTQTGFGWHVRRTPMVEIQNAMTYGVTGARALYIRFTRREARFQHLWQPLFLDPGNYRVSGQVRPERLQTAGGLRWQASCLLPEREILGESERFLGASDWRPFSFDFAVPEGCRYQELRLVTTGRRPFEHEIDGELWMDAMSLRKIRELRAAARIGITSDTSTEESGDGASSANTFATQSTTLKSSESQ